MIDFYQPNVNVLYNFLTDSDRSQTYYKRELCFVFRMPRYDIEDLHKRIYELYEELGKYKETCWLIVELSKDKFVDCFSYNNFHITHEYLQNIIQYMEYKKELEYIEYRTRQSYRNYKKCINNIKQQCQIQD